MREKVFRLEAMSFAPERAINDSFVAPLLSSPGLLPHCCLKPYSETAWEEAHTVGNSRMERH